jgi:hypothetical protein
MVMNFIRVYYKTICLDVFKKSIGVEKVFSLKNKELYGGRPMLALFPRKTISHIRSKAKHENKKK